MQRPSRRQRQYASTTVINDSVQFRNKWLWLVVVFLLMLAVVWQLSSDRNGLRQHYAVATGAMHRVELYSYRSPSSKGARWSSWGDFPQDSNLMVLEDDKLTSTGDIVPINIAHKQGLLHRGIWIAVLRSRGNNDDHEILLLRRTPSLKTCPNAWGLCGEHSDPGEDWVNTASRAILEELHVDDSNISVVNLLPGQSVLVRTPYTDLGRRDLQATGILAVVLTQEQANSIQPDDEVAGIKWALIDELETIHACNDEISALAKFVGQRLKHLGFTS